MRAISSTGQSLEDVIRDLRIMAKRGEPLAHLGKVMGWNRERTIMFCRTYDIDVVDLPKPRAPAPRQSRAPVASRQFYRRKPSGEVRSEQVMFNATPSLGEKLSVVASRRQLSRSQMIHQLMEAIEARNLWSDLLDSQSNVSVASEVLPKP